MPSSRIRLYPAVRLDTLLKFIVLICSDLSCRSRDLEFPHPLHTISRLKKAGIYKERERCIIRKRNKRKSGGGDSELDAKEGGRELTTDRREFPSLFNSFPLSFKFLSWMYGRPSCLLHHLHNECVSF